MSGEEGGFGDRATSLARAFDRSFSEAPTSGTEPGMDLLAIRVAGLPYALSLAETSGLHVDRVLTPLPTGVPELLGLVGIRATLVPVYDLRALLGHSGGEPVRWIALAGGGVVALAFERFESHYRIPQSALAADEAHAHGHVRRVAKTPAGIRPILFLPSVLEAIKARAQGSARAQER